MVEGLIRFHFLITDTLMKPHKILSPLAALIVCANSLAVSAKAEDLITANSAGGIELWMTVADARVAMPGATFERVSDGEGIALISVFVDGAEQFSLYAGEEDPESAIDMNASIESIQVMGDKYATAKGVKVGMSAIDVEAKFGKVTEVMSSEIESREYATFSNQPPGLLIQLWSETGTAGVYADGEMTTTKLSEGAKVHSITVMGADIMFDAVIGGIQLGMPEAELMAIAKSESMGVPEKGEDILWEAIGEAVQTWDFKEARLSVDMGSSEIGGEKEVFSITVKAASKLKTARGIGIGSTKEDAAEAYADYPTDEFEADVVAENGNLLIGSIYGGMIFKLDNGIISEIFLGASAE